MITEYLKTDHGKYLFEQAFCKAAKKAVPKLKEGSFVRGFAEFLASKIDE